MNDIATLKSLTNIKPIATLGRATDNQRLFNKIHFERESARGQHENGVVLTISDNSYEEVLEWADHIAVPFGTVRVRRLVTERDLDSLQLTLPMSQLRNHNHAIMVSDDVAVFRFSFARWNGSNYHIGQLNRYFDQLRMAYLLCPTSGQIYVPIRLGSVNHVYTSRAQMEEVLYPMAYHFFREDTEF